MEFKLLSDIGFDAKAVATVSGGVSIKYINGGGPAVNLSARQIETLYHKLFIEEVPCECKPKPPLFVRTL